MKKLRRRSTVHPSPPPPSQPPPTADPLSFLPVAIFALAAALTPQDREVLAYLLSRSSVSSTTGKSTKHTPASSCDCFSCYTSYWARWDSSPNHQLIHEIIDAYEDWVLAKNKGFTGKNRGGRRERRKKAAEDLPGDGVDRIFDVGFHQAELGLPEPAEYDGDEGASGSSGEELPVRGSVKKLVNFICERIWRFWG